MSDASPPLNGIRVIDFTRVLAGPFATQTLADLGAEVIKVEHPLAPDQFRFRKPELGGQSASFLSLNRNKRSVTIDLASSAGREVVLDLISTADVLVENFTSRVMRRYGLDYASIGERFPKLIFCSISAYGREGSRADAPGYDPVIAAESGIASLSYLGYHYLASGEDAPRYGRHAALGGPAGYFDASDGIVMIIASSDRDFRAACAIVGLPDLAEEERFFTFAGRLAALAEINTLFAAKLKLRPRDDWVRRFRASDIPAAPFLSVGEAMTSDLSRERGLISQIPHPTAGTIPNIASALRFSATPVAAPAHAPGLGADNLEVLGDLLGYDAARLSELHVKGAFGTVGLAKQ